MGGILATVLSALAAGCLWVEPVGLFSIGASADWLGLAVFLANGLLLSLVVEGMHRTQTCARLAEAELHSPADRPPAEGIRGNAEERFAREKLKARFPVKAMFAAAVIMLAGVGWMIYRNMTATVEADHWETHTYLVIQDLDRLLGGLNEAEAAAHGYRLTGDDRTLEAYHQAIGVVGEMLPLLEQMVEDDPAQHERVLGLEGPIQRKLAELNVVIQMRKTNDPTAARNLALAALDPGLMDDLRRQVAKIQAEETQLLGQRVGAKNTGNRRTLQALVAGGLLSVTILGLVFMVLRRENTQRLRAERELRQHRDRLEEAITARTQELAQANRLLQTEVDERKRGEAAKSRLAAIVESTDDAIVSKDLDGTILTWNAGAERMFGWPAAEILGQPVTRLIPPELLAEEEQILQRLKHGERVQHYETVRVTRDGRPLEVSLTISPLWDREGQLVGASKIIRDIAAHKQAEAELHKLNRALRARSKSDQAMMRATEELAYLQEVCRIIVEDCGHAMVWIGYAEEDEVRTVRPVAQAGFEEGYLETLRISWADTDRGRGPTGTAIRTGQPCGCRNMLTDPLFAPWRAEAEKHGYASSLALPLRTGEKTIGVLTIYSRQPESFTEAEEKLLTELADDLAHGITILRFRRAHAQTETALRESEERFRTLANAMPQLAWIARSDGHIFWYRSTLVRIHRHHAGTDGRLGLAAGS